MTSLLASSPACRRPDAWSRWLRLSTSTWCRAAVDGGVALLEVTLVELADGDGERPARRRGEGDGDPDDGEEGHGHDGCDSDHVHAKSMTRGCHSVADAGPMHGPSPGYSRNPGEFVTQLAGRTRDTRMRQR